MRGSEAEVYLNGFLLFQSKFAKRGLLASRVSHDEFSIFFSSQKSTSQCVGHTDQLRIGLELGPSLRFVFLLFPFWSITIDGVARKEKKERKLARRFFW